MITIYQLGTVTIHAHQNERDVLEVKNKTLIPTSDPSRIVWSEFEMQPSDSQIKGVLIDGASHEQITRLRGLTERPIDIFGYELIGGNSCGCASCGCDYREIVWFHTLGTLQKIELREAKGGFEFTLQLERNPIWSPVNRIVWEFGVRTYHALQVDTLAGDSSDLVGSYPLHFNGEARWSKRQVQPYDLYNPDVWAIWHTGLRENYPQTGYGYGWNTTDPYRYVVGGDETIWNYSPTSSYAISNMSTAGILRVEVTRLNGAEVMTEYISYLDFGQLHSDMASVGGINTAQDVLYIPAARPPFILRAGALLETIYPDIRGAMPFGQLGKGVNIINIEAGADFAALHTFRRV